MLWHISVIFNLFSLPYKIPFSENINLSISQAMGIGSVFTFQTVMNNAIMNVFVVLEE